MPKVWRMSLTTAAGSMPGGVFTQETVSDRIDASGNICSRMASMPARKARAATAWRRKRCSRPSSSTSRTATPSACVRWVGIEIGWLRGAPSGTRPPREAGIHASRHRSRSYTQDEALCLRRSMASHAGGVTPTMAMPMGAARHF